MVSLRSDADAGTTLALQIGDEIAGLFDFLQSVYGIFGFEFQLELSTRPEKFLGKIETWDAAEKVGFTSYIPCVSEYTY